MADKRNEFATMNVEVDVLDGDAAAFVGVERLGYIADL
jgi:hypothetical protein